MKNDNLLFLARLLYPIKLTSSILGGNNLSGDISNYRAGGLISNKTCVICGSEEFVVNPLNICCRCVAGVNE